MDLLILAVCVWIAYNINRLTNYIYKKEDEDEDDE